MKCEEISQEQWLAYFDGHASFAERRRVEEHAAGCAACRARAEEFGRLWGLLDEVPAIEPSLGFDASVRQRVAAEPRRRWFGWLAPWPRLALSAAVVAALAIVVLVKLPSRHPRPAGPVAVMHQEDFNAIKDLNALEDYDVVTNLDALSELPSAATTQPQQPQ